MPELPSTQNVLYVIYNKYINKHKNILYAV